METPPTDRAALLGEAVIARAMRQYDGCTCDECLIPYLFDALRPYMPEWGAQ